MGKHDELIGKIVLVDFPAEVSSLLRQYEIWTQEEQREVLQLALDSPFVDEGSILADTLGSMLAGL